MTVGGRGGGSGGGDIGSPAAMTDNRVTLAEESAVAAIGEESRMKAAMNMMITTVAVSR